MDLLQDSRWTMQGLNSRLKGFLEQVNKLQEANLCLEGQIADWGLRNAPHPQEWTQQESTVDDLRSQVRLPSITFLIGPNIEPCGTPTH